MRGRRPGPGRLKPVTKRDGSRAYLAEWQDATGGRCRRILSSDRRIAERTFAAIIRQRDLELAGLAVEQGQDRLLTRLRDSYLVDLKLRRSQHHHARSRAALNRILSELTARKVRDLRPDEVSQYLRDRVRDGASHRTANLDFAALRAMLNWAVRTRLIAANPLAGVRGLPEGKAHAKVVWRALTEDEVQRLLVAARASDDQENQRVAAIRTIRAGSKGRKYAAKPRLPRIPQVPFWITLIETGARWGELSQATWGDLDEQAGHLTIRAITSKSRKERSVPLREYVLAELHRVKVAHARVLDRLPRSSELLFLSPTGNRLRPANCMRMFNRLLEDAGIPKVNDRSERVVIHSLRHTAATRLGRAGVGLLQVQKILGHCDPKLTAAIYTHFEAEDLRGAVDRLPPLDGSGPRIHGSKLASASGDGTTPGGGDPAQDPASQAVGVGGGTRTRTGESRICNPSP